MITPLRGSLVVLATITAVPLLPPLHVCGSAPFTTRLPATRSTDAFTHTCCNVTVRITDCVRPPVACPVILIGLLFWIRLHVLPGLYALVPDYPFTRFRLLILRYRGSLLRPITWFLPRACRTIPAFVLPLLRVYATAPPRCVTPRVTVYCGFCGCHTATYTPPRLVVLPLDIPCVAVPVLHLPVGYIHVRCIAAFGPLPYVGLRWLFVPYAPAFVFVRLRVRLFCTFVCG